jgi:hypothetical protein
MLSPPPKPPETIGNEPPPMGPGSWIEVRVPNPLNVQPEGLKRLKHPPEGEQ